MEDRLAPAVTASLAGTTLNVVLDAANDVATLTGTTSAGTDIQVAGTGFAATPFPGVGAINVSDAAANAGQMVTLTSAGTNRISLTGAVNITGIETVVLSTAAALQAGSFTETGATSGVQISTPGVTTGGIQAYNDAAMIAAAATLDTTNGGTNPAGAAISLAAASGGSLTLNAGTAGAVTVSGAVDNVSILTVTNSGGATFQGSVGAGTAGAVTLADTTGTIAFQGGTTRITTLNTAAKGYNVSLTSATTAVTNAATFLNTGTVTLAGAAADNVGFLSGLTVNGAAVTAPVGVVNTGNLSVAAGSFDGAGSTVNAGSVTLTGGTLTAPSGSFNVSGNFSHSGGTFSANGGTTTLTGTGQSLGGATTFNNLSKTVAIADTLTFAAGASNKTTVTGALTLQGASGNLLSLRSATPGTAWQIDAQGGSSLGFVDVRDGDNVNAALLKPTGSVDSGNNTGWLITAANGAVSYDSTGGGLRLVKNGPNLELRDAVNNLIDSRLLSGVPSVTINGANGVANSLTVDGTLVLSGAITFNGGGLPATPGNSLTILGGSFTTDTYTYTSAHNGSVQLGTGGQLVNYTNLTPLINTGTAANIVFNLPSGTVGASLQDDGIVGNNTSQLASTNAAFETTTFTDPTNSLTINAGAGTDTITTAANLSGDFTAALTVNGDTVTTNALNLTTGTGNLSITANTINVNGGITTTGTTGSVSFNVNTQLTQAAAGTIIAKGGVTETGVGAVSLSAGITTTNAPVSFAGAVTLAGDVTVSAGLGSVTFGGTVNGGHTLTVNSGATTTFGGAVGAIAALTSLTTDAPGTTAINGGMVKTLGAQAYGDAVTLGANATLTASTVTFSSTVAGGGNDLTVNGAAVLTAAVTGIGALAVTGPTAINTTTVTSTGAQTYTGPVTLGANVTLTASTVTFGSTLTGGGNSLTVAGGAAFDGAATGLTTLAVSGSTAINTTTITTSGAQGYGGPVTLGANATLTASTVTFGSALAGGGTSLTVTGAAAFDGAATGLTTLSVTGATAINTTTITSTGPQTYTGPVTLGANATLTANTVTFNSTVAGAGNGLTVNGAAVFDGTATGLAALTVSGATIINTTTVTSTGAQTYTGPATLGANVTLTASTVTFGSTLTGGGHSLTVTGGAAFDGAATGLTTLSVTGATAINTTTITTSGAQGYGGPVTLGANVTLTASTVTFGSTVTGAGNSLTVTGAAVFGGAVAGLTTLAVSAATAINTTTVMTVGAQAYNGPVTLGANATLTASTVTFNSTLAGAGNSLTVNGGAVFNGTATGLAALTVSGATAINTTTVTSTGAQTYAGPVTLGANVTLTASTATFGSTLAGVGHSLTVAGSAAFDGAATGLTTLSVTGATAINTTTITTSGTQTYTGPVTLGTGVTLTASTVTFNSTVTGAGGTSLTISAGAVLNGGSVTTGGDQVYNGPVTLTLDTTLNAVNVTFGSTLDSDATPRNLNVNSGSGGAATFVLAVGGIHALAGLTINPVGTTAGTTTIKGGAVTTTGNQQYGDAVTLTANTSLTAKGGGNITFGATVDGTTAGGQSFAINTTGSVGFTGAVGSRTRLNALALVRVQDVTAAATVAAVSVLETGGSGTTTFNAAVDVSGAGGIILTTKAVALAAAVTSAGGPVTFNAPVILIGNVSVSSSGGTVTFASTINADGAANRRTLTLAAAAGNINFTGAVGGGQRLGTFAVASANNVSAAAIVAGSITQSAGTGTTTATGVLDANAVGGISLTGNAFNLSGGLNLSAGPLTVTASTLTASGPAINLGAGTFTLNLGGASSISAPIAGQGAALVKTGSGTLTLSAAETYTGPTTINGGTLALAATGHLFTGGSLIVAGDAATTFTLGGNDQVLFAVTLIGGQIIGPGSLASGTDFDVRSGTISAILVGQAGLVKSTVGVVTVTNASTYAGPTTINAGLLATTVTNALPVTTALRVAAGGAFQLNNVSQGVATLTGQGIVLLLGSNAVTLSVGKDGVSSYAEFDGQITGAGGLTKIGTGPLILAGANTYAGPTTVNGGFLVVDGSVASSTVFVNVGGTLNGKGVVGSVVANGGTVVPGTTGTAVLTVNDSLNLAGHGVFWPKLGGPTPGSAYDQLVVKRGTIDLGDGTSVVNLQIGKGFTPARYTSYTVMVNQTGQKINGTFSGMLWNGNKNVAPAPGRLEEGAMFQGSDGNPYLIGYNEGSAKDVVVTRVTPNFAAVRQLYKDVLNRPQASFKETTFWAGFLDTGDATQAQVAQAFLLSREYRNDLVTNDFKTFLGRAPRPDEFDLFATTTSSGLYAFTEPDVAFALLTSPEYNDLHVDATNFVRSLYDNVLNGTSTNGLGAVVATLASASLTRAQVVTNFLGSQAAYELAINSYYTTLLHRDAVGNELQVWLGNRSADQTAPVDVLTVFLSSAEYLADVSAETPRAG